MNPPVSVIDLFAGPGGLAEGFASLESDSLGSRPFKIGLSIENEDAAFKTLKLRSFFRQFTDQAPDSYYEFLRGELGATPEQVLYRLPANREALEHADREARQITLGTRHAEVYRRVREAVAKKDCVIIGGPPCQAYSVIGRSRNYGDRKKQYSPADDQRNFLYKEYLRLIAKFQPLAFVMENVKGILSAKVNGERLFDSIVADLQDPCRVVTTRPEPGRSKHQYRLFSFVTHPSSDLLGDRELLPTDYVIRSDQYGVPQARDRVIILGVREDLVDRDKTIPLLNPSSDTVSVSEAISDLPRLRSRLSKVKGGDSAEIWVETIRNSAKPFSSTGRLRAELAKVRKPRADYGSEFGLRRSETNQMPNALAKWYFDSQLGHHVTNHVTRGHILNDLLRYFYLASQAKHLGRSPTLDELPAGLWPNHANARSGKFADRFRVQLADRPATTVTSHISKDGHYYIHPDPTQCRSLTVREAARIQTFPDNYFFAGTRTQQFVQVGNAVPPFLALQLARTVASIIR